MATAFYNDLEMAELGSSSPPSNNQNPQPAKSRLQTMLEEEQRAENFMPKSVIIQPEAAEQAPQPESKVEPTKFPEFTEIIFKHEESIQTENGKEAIREQESVFATRGELTFNGSLSEPTTNKENPQIEPEKRKPSFKIPDPIQKASETVLNYGERIWKSTYKNSKEFGAAMFKLAKENIFFPSKKNEGDPKKAQAEAEKKAKRLAVIKEFFVKLRENLNLAVIKKQEEEINLEKRLGTAGLSVGEKNRFLGKNRNESNRDIQSFYHLHQTYFGMVEIKRIQKKTEHEQSLQAAKPVVNMHGAIEGGTAGGKVNISTTGGAGVG